MAMGHMPLDCFSNARSWDVKNKHDIGGGTWTQVMCPNTLKKRKLNPFAESFGTKQSCKSSYTILEGPLQKKCGEWTKAKINALI
jgi:hypothetical protein